MMIHSCLLCLGSNFDRLAKMDSAREALKVHFPDIRFSKEMETEAIGEKFLSPFSNQVASFETTLSSEEVRHILKEIERTHGRSPEDKAQGIIKLDIDLLMVDDHVLKPKDLEKEFVLEGMRQLHRL